MKIAFYLILIVLTPLIFLLSYRLVVYDQNFYENEYLKLGVYDNFESREVVNLQTKSLINYYCCDSQLDGGFYTEREKIHLKDVKKLLESADIILLIFFIPLIGCTAFIVLRKKYQLLIRTFKIAPTITLVSLLVLWITTLINFNFIFINFHIISFQNDYWLLPEGSNLIKLFPQQFFVDFGNRIAIYTAAVSIALIIISFLLSKYYVTKKH